MKVLGLNAWAKAGEADRAAEERRRRELLKRFSFVQCRGTSLQVATCLNLYS
jgi:hypothetical protein